MSDSGESGDIRESFVEDENKVVIEETSVNLDCVKNEPNKEAFDFIEDSHPTRYTITLEYENLFGEPSHQTKIEEDYDHLIGFLDNDVMMENAMIKLEAIKEEDDGSFNNFHCNKCKGIYKGYCLKCSTLLHILNNNLAFVNSGSELNTTPTDILEIRENSWGKGVYLLRTLPINVIFGPFEGILGIESTVGHSWKIMYNKLRNIKSGNWMKHIVCASSASLKNLDIFQIDGSLYFQTNREITEGEELLIYYDDEKLQQLDNSEECLYTPQKQEKLPKIFACTRCCLGFGSNKCLIEHKGKCRVEQSRGMKDFVLVECHYCKMWIEKWEHEEHHVAYCLEKHHRMSSEYSEAVHRSDADVEEVGEGDCGTRACKRRYQREICSRRKDRRDDLQSDTKDNEQVQNTIATNKKSCLQQNHLNKHRSIKPFKCDICMMKFTEKGSLKMHIKNKHTDDATDKDYKCSECSYQTNRKGDFQRHLNKHKGIKPFTCDICAMKFTEKGNLTKHIKNMHAANASAKDYKCLECTFQTKYKANFQMHLNKHANKLSVDGSSKDYKCSECFYQTNEKRYMQMHLNAHKGIKPFQCNICMAKFTLKDSLNKHIRNKHTNDANGKDYKCSDCFYATNDKGNLQKHLNKHSGIKPFTCDICMKEFSQKGNLKMHIKNKHTKNKHTGGGGVKDYKCSECSYQTNYKGNLQVHLDKPFQCDICAMKFTTKQHLKRHIKNRHTDVGDVNHLNKHRNIKSFTCDICMMKFSRKDSLKLHIRNKHTDDGGVKDYKCSECWYQTNTKGNLQSHLNKHTGIRPFTCDICAMMFSTEQHLKRHIKDRHTDVEDVNHLDKHRNNKSFTCDICMMKFSRKGSLKLHIRNKHTDDGGVKDYKCSECWYQTNHKGSLQSHLNKHTGIRPFTCDICAMKYTRKEHLARHIRNKHTNDGGVKDYKCLECSYQTNVISHFHTHLNKHRGITFTCDICMKEFSQKGNLARHINTKHAKG